jgi:hypothetical protein
MWFILLYLELPDDAGIRAEVLRQYLIGRSLSARASKEALSNLFSRFSHFAVFRIKFSATVPGVHP